MITISFFVVEKIQMGIKNAEFDADFEPVGKVSKNSC
jgi:hypothetical protein